MPIYIVYMYIYIYCVYVYIVCMCIYICALYAYNTCEEHFFFNVITAIPRIEFGI